MALPLKNRRFLSRLLPALVGLAAGTLGAAEFDTTPGPGLPVLTRAEQVRQLSPEEAARSYPVKIEAHVIFVEQGSTVFLQDETGGTFFRGPATKESFQPGERVEVTGTSYPGLYVPGITESSLRRLGPGPLPEPHRLTFDALASGRFNYERALIEGTVRAVEPLSTNRCRVWLAVGVNRLEVQVRQPVTEAPADLVDGEVSVAGLAAGFINNRRQLVQPHLRVGDFQAIRMLRPPPADPWELAVTPVASLLSFAPGQMPGHRLKVRGVVTHHQDAEAVYLRDGEVGVMAQVAGGEVVSAGDVVEVLGFPVMGPFSAMLEDAIYRRVDHVAEPVSIVTTVPKLFGGSYDGDLVSVEAELLRVLTGEQEQVLILQEDNQLLRARLPLGGDGSGLRPGSRFLLTGVCRVQVVDSRETSFSSRPEAVELLLRGVSDLVLLRAAPWWTPQRLANVVAALFLAVLAVLLWVWALQQRVNRQTAIIAQKLQAEAAIEERQRIAREVHDTLEQELVGLALRMDTLGVKVRESPHAALIATAARLVGRIQNELRNFVWDLREPLADEAALGPALAKLVERVNEEQGASVAVEGLAAGEDVRLSALRQHNLMRVVREAIINAVKHSQAGRIVVSLERAGRELVLLVTDDGRGFDPAVEPPGHFGLVGMRERAHKLGARLSLTSQPGCGAVVELRFEG